MNLFLICEIYLMHHPQNLNTLLMYSLYYKLSFWSSVNSEDFHEIIN